MALVVMATLVTRKVRIGIKALALLLSVVVVVVVVFGGMGR